MDGFGAISKALLEQATVDVYHALLPLGSVLQTPAPQLAFIGGVHLIKLGAKRFTKDIDVELRVQKEPGVDRRVFAALDDHPSFEHVEITWETQNVSRLFEFSLSAYQHLDSYRSEHCGTDGSGLTSCYLIPNPLKGMSFIT